MRLTLQLDLYEALEVIESQVVFNGVLGWWAQSENLFFGNFNDAVGFYDEDDGALKLRELKHGLDLSEKVYFF